MKGRRHWTEADDVHIVQHWRDVCDADIGAALGRSSESVCNRRNLLGLKHEQGRSGKAGAIPPKPKGYTPEQVIWATHNKDTSAEARMMLGFWREFRKRRRVSLHAEGVRK